MDLDHYDELSLVAKSAKRSDVRDLLHHASREGMISFAGGLPDADLFDLTGINQAIEAVQRQSLRRALQYGPTEGQPRLCAAITELMRRRGVAATPKDILVTTGSQQGLDLLVRVLVNQDDLVAIEAPTYLAAVNVLTLTRPRFLTVPSTPRGMNVDALINGRIRPKLLYVVPTFSNPCGSQIPLEERVKLLNWAADNNVFIIEDDPYGELRFSEATPLPSLYQLASRTGQERARVGYLSTLSKCVAPGLRIGWLLAPDSVLDACVRIKQAMDLHTSSFVQEVAASYLESGQMDAAVERMRLTYESRYEVMREELENSFGDRMSVGETGGGMFLWARFNDGTHTRSLLQEALRNGVMFVPGGAFYAEAYNGTSELRLSFATNPPDQIREGVRRLKRAHAILHTKPSYPVPLKS